MIKTLLTLLLFLTSVLSYGECPKHTHEQKRLINLAYYTGDYYDLGYTLAAITVRESFVGSYVVRINPKDAGGGSYGLTHIQLDTAMWLLGEKNNWKARAEIIPKLMSSDAFALELAIRKLQAVQYSTNSWRELWGKYNGAGPNSDYSKGIQSNIVMLKSCYTF